jgi:hypothetical protein
MNLFHKFLLLLPAAQLAHAFPPAPHYTLFGIVRDQVGQTLAGEGARIILLKGGVEIGRAGISPALTDGHNYQLKVPIDHNRSGTTLYSEKAVPSRGLFSLVVEMNGSLFYPIEVSGSLTAGNGSERVRLDLTLGEDSDGDGLPDTWEEWQLYQAGLLPDGDGNWPIHLITRDGDYDGDGRSNHDEYVAGTFAGDATDYLALEIKEILPGKVRLEFYGITGKNYAIESSTGLNGWSGTPFSVVSATSETVNSHTASAVGILSVFVTPAPGGTKEFYRLSVR